MDPEAPGSPQGYLPGVGSGIGVAHANAQNMQQQPQQQQQQQYMAQAPHGEMTVVLNLVREQGQAMQNMQAQMLQMQQQITDKQGQIAQASVQAQQQQAQQLPVPVTEGPTLQDAGNRRRGVVDPKLVPRPRPFKGNKEDFDTWKFLFTTWLNGVDDRYKAMMDLVKDQVAEVDSFEFDDGRERLAEVCSPFWCLSLPKEMVHPLPIPVKQGMVLSCGDDSIESTLRVTALRNSHG